MLCCRMRATVFKGCDYIRGEWQVVASLLMTGPGGLLPQRPSNEPLLLLCLWYMLAVFMVFIV